MLLLFLKCEEVWEEEGKRNWEREREKKRKRERKRKGGNRTIE